MKDALGNKLEAGNLVLWNNMIAKIRDVKDGTLSIVDKANGVGRSMPSITLEITLVNPQQNVVIRVVDPASENIIEKVMAEGAS